ncbi:adhesion G protein-coupled receptor E5-like isoform X2 [Anguilla anguilla]|uniref:adhesion G protein-coupled receptor E5-like isoform X2 n=1 Tax=Anguilla anguilla TaxID=7936 RepID=UPI0015AA869A|nr:adhesion G protein-coupled receptor E5-like isoform X2 [Anguilla anguilla]
MRAVFLLILGLSFSLMADLALSACLIGFETRPDGCFDVDECADKEQPVCGLHAVCFNSDGSYYCQCNSGYSTKSRAVNFTRDSCKDINECREMRADCGPNAKCKNTPGSYNCSCEQGFASSNGAKTFLATDGITCKELTCNHFAPVGSHDQIPAGLEKVLSLMRDACNALNGSPRPEGETLLESLLTTIDELLSAGPLKDNGMVTRFLKVVEDALRLIGFLLPNNRIRKSANHTDVQFLVKRGQMSPKGKISLSSEHVLLDTHWETAAGDTTYPGFAAASLMTYKGLESSTNDSFQGLSAKHNGTKFSMNSKVVTVSVSNENTGHLQKPVTLTLSHLQKTEENRSHSCVYWDGASGGWSERGCEVVRSNSTHTVCACSHLSSFAVLMALYEVEDAFHLEVITWVGLSVSQVCLLLCIVTFFCCRSIQGTRNTIHLHLCVCLFIANLVFLAGISSTQNKVGCALVAGLLHFFFLAAFCWMCLEGVQLYRMVVLVFNTTLRPRCMTAAGYGIPAIIVAISAGVRSEGYGTERFCWLTLKQGLIWSFFGPVCIIITVNAFFFLITVWKLAEKFSSLNPDLSNLRKIKAFTITAIAQLCVLGTMWIFGCFLFEKGNRPLEYIFTVLNSLQGVLLFLMHCLLSKPVREEYGKFLSHLCTSQKKYSEFSTNQSGSSRASKSAQHTGESRI